MQDNLRAECIPLALNRRTCSKGTLNSIEPPWPIFVKRFQHTIVLSYFTRSTQYGWYYKPLFAKLHCYVHHWFQNDQVATYKVQYKHYDEQQNCVKLKGLDEFFSEKVFEFFKNRIEQQYPLTIKETNDPYEVIRDKHESFMKSSAGVLIGRDDILNQVFAKC